MDDTHRPPRLMQELWCPAFLPRERPDFVCRFSGELFLCHFHLVSHSNLPEIQHHLHSAKKATTKDEKTDRQIEVEWQLDHR